MRKDILSVENITMQFGGVVAVNNLSLHIPEGQIVALIGPNGAGKTTAFNCITGVYEPCLLYTSFSRWKVTAPLPPLPARTVMVTLSTNGEAMVIPHFRCRAARRG